ncbi:hypothetical protein ACXHQ9_17300 [Vibrio cincinnatiensis]
MKRMLGFALIAVIQGCTNKSVVTETLVEASCIGTTAISGDLSDKFRPIQDSSLLAQSLGEPLQGKLCQGVVYQNTQDVTIYRAWNSTNPHSQFGQWWAFEQPSGKTADYRKNYEICYQWSPLDKLSKCTLKAGSKVVVGNGQSAECSAYLTYPVSEVQQIFIVDSGSSVADCQVYDSVMSWE